MSQPEDDPRDEVQAWPCRKCNGRGTVRADLRPLGAGGELLAAGCQIVRDTEGRHQGHAIVCPRCDGDGTDPDPTNPQG